MSKIYGIGDEEELDEDLQKELPSKIIAELEKIRAEINALDKWGETFYRYNLALGDCIEIIDSHISELKEATKENS